MVFAAPNLMASQLIISAEQMTIVREILAPYAKDITCVGLFGSRATGKARPDSDIDLVLYGSVDEATINHLRTDFEDSNLAVTVDIIAYNALAHPPLKEHIDAVMQPLFTQNQLKNL